MSRSWGHAVRPLAEDEKTRWAEYVCGSGKCQEQVTHATAYSYITGRAGRTSWSGRRVCMRHAEAFAAKHGVDITDAPAQEHAIQQVIGQAFGISGDDVVFCHATTDQASAPEAGED